MKSQPLTSKLFIVIALVVLSTNLLAQDPNFHIYLCFGQSNMEGSAKIEEQDKTVHSRFKMMPSMDCEERGRMMGHWYAAEPPLSQCWSGLSPSDYFGRNMIENLPDSIKFGVIVVAIGGCDIRLFDKEKYTDHINTYQQDWFQNKIKYYGGNPYERLITLAKQAQEDGVIKGFILHQGETNTGDQDWPQYVKAVYTNMLNDLNLNAEDAPLLSGEVVHKKHHGKCAAMNPIINTLPDVIPTAHVISSLGCEAPRDSVHFNSAGVRELGKRYAEKMLEVKGYKSN